MSHPVSSTPSSRRKLLLGAATASLGALASAAVPDTVAADKRAPHQTTPGKLTSNTLTTADGTVLYYKDWGSGPVVVFSHGYPLSSDAWEYQMFFLLNQGYRVVAHDRRGFGRSSQPAGGYDFDTFADDLATLINTLNLKDITLVGHSMGGGEVARYLSRHGDKRVRRVAFISSVTPFLLKTESNPHGAPVEVFDGFWAAVLKDRSQWNRDVTLPYYSFNRPGAVVSEGVREDYWRQGMATGLPAAYHAIGAFGQTDFREDLKKIRVPALVLHGDDDQIVPLAISGKLTAEMTKARLVVYPGGSHGLILTQKDQVNKDLLDFLRS